MKLLQKILSHGLLIAFILAAVYGYTQREKLFPQWFPRSDHTHQQAEKDAQSKSKPVIPQENLPAPTADTGTIGDESATGEAATVEPDELARNDNPGVDERLDVSTTTEAGTQNEVTEAEPVPARASAEIPGATTVDEKEAVRHAQTDISETAPPAQEKIVLAQEDIVLEEAPRETAEPESVVVKQDAQAPVQEAESGTTDEPGGDKQLQEQLVQARQYFWQRNLQAAEEIYTSLAESYPDNPDVWGEIGNFYYSLRKRVPMIEAYTRSAKLLIARGDPRRARQLVSILYRLGAPQARQLEMELMQQAGG